jgi:hypothetical protein
MFEHIPIEIASPRRLPQVSNADDNGIHSRPRPARMLTVGLRAAS